MQRSAGQSDILLQRERELAGLTDLLDAIERGAGSALVIEGEPGIGKSRLLQSARVSAGERGIRVLFARASELERDVPFGVVRQLFEPAVAALGDEDADALFTGAAALAREVLATAPLDARPEFDVPGRALHGLHWLAAGLAEGGPLLIVVDDIQWADEGSLQWLAYTAARLADLPVGLLLATRTQEPGSRPILDVLVANSAVEIVRPAALTRDAVAELAATRLEHPCDDAFAEACHTATGGNPFLVVETLDELARRDIAPVAANRDVLDELGPRSVRRAMVTRLDQLSEDCRTVAHAVAILGDGTPLPAVARLAGMEPLQAADCVPALHAAGVLTDDSGAPGFVHPLVRSAIEASMAPSERTEWHVRAREQLAADGAPADRIAVHVMAAEPCGDPRATELLLAAARIARGRGALDSAHAYLERALNEPPDPSLRATVLGELAAVELRLMRGRPFAHMGEAMEPGVPADQRTVDPKRRAVLARDWASMIAPRHPERAMSVLEEVAAEAPDEATRTVIAATAWGLSFASLDARRAYLAHPPAAASEELDDLGRALDAAFDGRAEEARALALRVLARGELIEAVGFETVTHYAPALALLFADDLDGAIQALSATLAAAQRAGSTSGVSLTGHIRAMAWLRVGDLTEVETDAALARPEVMPASMPLAPAAMVEVLVERGELDAAAKLATDSGLADIAPVSPQAAPVIASRVRLRLAQGRVEDALAEIDLCARLEDEWGVVTPALTSWRAWRAEALAALSNNAGARASAEAAVAQARAFGAARPLGIALRMAGLVHGDESLLEEAAEVLDGSPARLERARVLCELGAMRRRAGQARDARPYLRRAHELARACGATALEQRAATELRASGDRPRTTPNPRADLTTSERRTAAMAAEGHTNREIAQALFVSEKTVERHLTAAYRKLGVQRRGQLRAALERG